MDKNELRKTLAVHLANLKANLEAVPLEILKTKYRKPYDKLRHDIADAASAYVREVTFQGIRLRKDLFDTTRPQIEEAIRQSGILKQISAAAFRRPDISEIDALAVELRRRIKAVLKPVYDQYLCLYMTEDCFADPPRIPELYNEASGCICRNGVWIPWEIEKGAFLMYVYKKQSESPAPKTAA